MILLESLRLAGNGEGKNLQEMQEKSK